MINVQANVAAITACPTRSGQIRVLGPGDPTLKRIVFLQAPYGAPRGGEATEEPR